MQEGRTFVPGSEKERSLFHQIQYPKGMRVEGGIRISPNLTGMHLFHVADARQKSIVPHFYAS
jgi:hypothetical protein